MFCGTSSTCPLTQCPWWQNGDHPRNNDINLYRLDDFPCTLDRSNDDHPQYNDNSHQENTSSDCSNNSQDRDCHHAYENIKQVINFIDQEIYPLIGEYAPVNFEVSSLSLAEHTSYIILQNIEFSPLQDIELSPLQVVTEWGSADCYNNAFTLPNQEIIFGQYNDHNNQRYSTADQLEIVAHEFGHILIKQVVASEGFDSNSQPTKNEPTNRCQAEALEESLCDWFAIIVSRYIRGDWNWIIGQNMAGYARDFQNPLIAHIDQYRCLPSGEDPNSKNDWGYIHTNCGIHNKACAEIMQNIDDLDFLIKLFCYTLVELRDKTASNGMFLQDAPRTNSSNFSDSGKKMKSVVEAMLDLSESERQSKLNVIDNAFNNTGISLEEPYTVIVNDEDYDEDDSENHF